MCCQWVPALIVVRACLANNGTNQDQKTAGDFDPVGMKKTSRGVVEGIVTTLSIVIPAFLLLGGIAVLYFESRQGAKLGLAAVFTFLFAASVALLTSAKRVEVFGASAAYVQVLESDWSTANIVLIVMPPSSLCILPVLDVPCRWQNKLKYPYISVKLAPIWRPDAVDRPADV
jgi:hypothetical protein